MRALRTLLVIAVILGGLFVAADRIAVNLAEDEAAQRIKAREGLVEEPEVSIKGFPFLTQVLGGSLHEVDARMTDFTAGSGDAEVRISELDADLRDVEFSGDFSSAKAATATGTARIPYEELLEAARAKGPAELRGGIKAEVVGLSDGGNGKVKVDVKIEAPIIGTRDVEVLSSVNVKGDNTVQVRADNLPSFGIDFAERQMRQVTDISQLVDGLPGGIELDKVTPEKNGIAVTVKGSDVQLTG
ncbi:DUF2993 domain-containing protein [Streptomyces sp. NPDC060194]|uniref:LmeA family phospholipid-binding protein n=1 Tax=Streptomyces sp. NPDC060194 TaxID=3347069 RepID=UPI00364688E0